MSAKIVAGRFVSPTRPTAGMGWWYGRVKGVNPSNGLCVVELLWTENETDTKELGVANGKHDRGRDIVGFFTAREAYRYMRRKRRAFVFDRQFGYPSID